MMEVLEALDRIICSSWTKSHLGLGLVKKSHRTKPDKPSKLGAKIDKEFIRI